MGLSAGYFLLVERETINRHMDAFLKFSLRREMAGKQCEIKRCELAGARESNNVIKA